MKGLLPGLVKKMSAQHSTFKRVRAIYAEINLNRYNTIAHCARARGPLGARLFFLNVEKYLYILRRPRYILYEAPIFLTSKILIFEAKSRLVDIIMVNNFSNPDTVGFGYIFVVIIGNTVGVTT